MSTEQYSPPAGDLMPVPVHVVSGALLAAPKRELHRTEYLTVVLTADDPVQQLLPQSPNRVCAWLQALDNDVVIGKDTSQAGAATNTVASNPRPSGAVIPKANTAPYPLDSNDVVYVGLTTTGSASRVSVTAVYRVQE